MCSWSDTRFNARRRQGGEEAGPPQPQVVDGPRRETAGINTKKRAAARRIVISPDM
jgi:hypothetical protein